MGHAEWSEDERFSTNVQRVHHRDELDEHLVPLFFSKSKLEWREILNRHGVPSDIVATVPEALEKATWVEHDHPDGGSSVKSLIGSYRLDGEILVAPRRSPNLGEHANEVIEDWLGE